eukprot:SAG31_NODE_23_length_33717_cov_17.863585_16_plen_39_part_00
MMGTFKAHFNDAYYTTETVPGMNEVRFCIVGHGAYRRT